MLLKAGNLKAANPKSEQQLEIEFPANARKTALLSDPVSQIRER